MNLSEEQILALAPDEASRKAGKDLARKEKWVSYGANDAAIWGECQGSGSKPYQTQADAVNIAFKCSCPSRKFPCKHGLGLMLLHARNKDLFTITQQPAWVTDWISKRVEKAETGTTPAAAKPVDETAQAKRRQERIKKVNGGTEDLLLWIKDIIRKGLINIPGNENTLRNMARRMVDAQAPGLAAIINSFDDINFYQDGWQTKFLDKLVQLYLLISGYRNIDTLNTELAQEILNLIGFTQNQEELKARDGINDNWFVLGKQVTEEAQLTIERNWLYGTESGRYALIMQFYVRGAGKGIALTPGTCTVAELVFFNPALSDRALIKIQHNVNNKGTVKGFTGWTDVIDHQVQMSEKNPFAGDMPFIVEQVRPVQYQGRWWLQDHERKLVQMNMPDASLWQFMAMSGGHPGTVAVVGRENEYTPLGTWHNKNYIAL